MYLSRIITLLLLFIVLLISCSDEENEPINTVQINPVTFSCLKSDIAACDSAVGKSARLGISPGSDADCSAIFSATADSTLASNFDVHQILSSLSFLSNPERITATVSNGWLDREEQSAQFVTQGQAVVCILIEGFGTSAVNGTLEKDEVVCQGTVSFDGTGDDISGNPPMGIADCTLKQ